MQRRTDIYKNYKYEDERDAQEESNRDKLIQMKARSPIFFHSFSSHIYRKSNSIIYAYILNVYDTRNLVIRILQRRLWEAIEQRHPLLYNIHFQICLKPSRKF